MPMILPKKRLDRILASVPGRRHHPWPTYRARSLGLCGREGISDSCIHLEPYEHLALHWALGNGSPMENLNWITRGHLDLSSFPCIVMFGGVVKPSKAAEVYEEKYTRPVDPRIVKAFAQRPYNFDTRWFSGVSFHLKPIHLIALYSL